MKGTPIAKYDTFGTCQAVLESIRKDVERDSPPGEAQLMCWPAPPVEEDDPAEPPNTDTKPNAKV